MGKEHTAIISETVWEIFTFSHVIIQKINTLLQTWRVKISLDQSTMTGEYA
jgi:hypothetical protein